MEDLTAWIIIGGLLLTVACLFSLSNQIQRNLHFILQVLDNNHKVLIERIEQAARLHDTASNWSGVERRIAQRRDPRVQMAHIGPDGERRKAPGRRREDFAAAHAAGAFPAS